MAGVCLLDSRDSFTWNLAQAFEELGVQTQVRQVDDFRIEDLRALSPDLVVVGPGPRGPDELPHLVDVTSRVSREFPVFGVCLGLQALILSHGGKVGRAREPVHGKRTPIVHKERSFFRGLPNPLWVMRYHSLVSIEVPDEFEVIARDEDEQVMAIMRNHPPYCAAVQFHPESIGTSGGMEILRNVLQENHLSAAQIVPRAGGIPSPEQEGRSVKRFLGAGRSS